MLATALRVFRESYEWSFYAGHCIKRCLGESYGWSFYAGHCIKSV